jgi:dynein heavy chain
MQFDIRLLVEKATFDYFKMEREQFVLDRAGQVVINIDMTIWTSETEEAINTGGVEGLGEYFDELQEKIEKIVKVIKTPLSQLNRCTLEALIVLDVHNMNVIQELVHKKVDDVTDFNYEAQMRYYWQQSTGIDAKEQSIIKIINSTLDYNYEYLGNSTRLVITPLTDRCYRTLCSALYLNYGGAPEGPAGTGKTETTKDLSRCLGNVCYVLNTSASYEYDNILKFFKGIAASGSWVVFDEFNRMDTGVLAYLSQVIIQI